jgi:hypothetical protein
LGTKGLGTRGFFLTAISPTRLLSRRADMAAYAPWRGLPGTGWCFQVVIESVGLAPIFLFLRQQFERQNYQALVL